MAKPNCRFNLDDINIDDIDNVLHDLAANERDIVAPEAPAVAVEAEEQAVRVGRVYLDGEQIIRQSDDGKSALKISNANKREKIKQLIGLRDGYMELVAEHSAGNDIGAVQQSLHKLYQAFYVKHGALGKQSAGGKYVNFPAEITDDGSFDQLLSLEIEDRGEFSPSKILTDPNFAAQANLATQADTVADALDIVLTAYGHISVARIAEMTGKTEAAIELELLSEKLAYPHPDKGLMAAEDFLSGDIVGRMERITEAKKAGTMEQATADILLADLQAAMPTRINADQIEVEIGQTWIDEAVRNRFLNEQFGDASRVEAVKVGHKWIVPGRGHRPPTPNDWYYIDGVRFGIRKILEHALNGTTPTIFHPKVQDQKQLVNEVATEQAKQIVAEVNQRFYDYIFNSDPKRHRQMVDLYNQRRNRYALYKPKTEGVVRFPGISSHIDLRANQVRAVRRFLRKGNLLLAHDVGYGKTFTMITAAMESIRLGRVRKVLFAAENATTSEIAEQAQALYPLGRFMTLNPETMKTAKSRTPHDGEISGGGGGYYLCAAKHIQY